MSYFPSKSHVLHSGREGWGAQKATIKPGPVMGSGSQGGSLYFCVCAHALTVGGLEREAVTTTLHGTQDNLSPSSETSIQSFICFLQGTWLNFCRFKAVCGQNGKVYYSRSAWWDFWTWNWDFSWTYSEIIEKERHLPSLLPRLLEWKLFN